MFFHARLVVFWKTLLECGSVFQHHIQNAALAVDPTLFPASEQAIEEAIRQHLGGQCAIEACPAHIALDALAEGLLRNADLQRAKAGFTAYLCGDGLIDRGATRPAAGEPCTSHQAADGIVMAVAGPGQTCREVIEPADHMNVVAKRSQRRKTGCE